MSNNLKLLIIVNLFIEMFDCFDFCWERFTFSYFWSYHTKLMVKKNVVYLPLKSKIKIIKCVYNIKEGSAPRYLRSSTFYILTTPRLIYLKCFLYFQYSIHTIVIFIKIIIYPFVGCNGNYITHEYNFRNFFVEWKHIIICVL